MMTDVAGKLAGQVALVTGAGQGIGLAIARKLSSDGARLVVNDIDRAACDAAVATLREAGGIAIGVAGDVTDPAFAADFVGAAMTAFGDLHILVNNAGYPWDAVIQKTSDEQFAAMLNVHVTAPFRILRAALDPIRSLVRGEQAAGRTVMRKIVNISSLSGLYGNAGQVGYSAAKSALVGMTRSLCKEWGRYHVNVNCVAFGLIGTRLAQPVGNGATIEIGDRIVPIGVGEDLYRRATEMVPLGRAGTPDEAAGAVYLLCIPESNYVSGQVLLCAGGLTV
jgi:3-oxoacyl-[acyl-carrier protein] reductase